MVSSVKNSYTDEQITAWLRGLLTVAWADGHFDPEEKEYISQLTHEDLSLSSDIESLEKISPEELGASLGSDGDKAENFLRTAVMVAIADGVYSASEAELMREFSSALDLDIEALKSLETTLYHPDEQASESSEGEAEPGSSPHPHSDVLQPVKDWLDGMDVDDPRVAKFICKMVPPQCPFERDIKLFGHKVVHIPPMCKLNPLYEQLVGLRFRALSYIADETGEDAMKYM